LCYFLKPPIKRLRELRLWGPASITDEGLQNLAELQNLRELGFSHTKNLTKTGYASLAKLKLEIISKSEPDLIWLRFPTK
jgi:hypothetical protein